MAGFLQGLGIFIIVLSVLIPIILTSSPPSETSGNISLLSWYILIGGIFAGISWLAIAKIVENLEKINKNLTELINNFGPKKE
jgi:uncharacterized membrane protein YagU involved in acid resistance